MATKFRANVRALKAKLPALTQEHHDATSGLRVKPEAKERALHALKKQHYEITNAQYQRVSEMLSRTKPGARRNKLQRRLGELSGHLETLEKLMVKK